MKYLIVFSLIFLLSSCKSSDVSIKFNDVEPTEAQNMYRNHFSNDDEYLLIFDNNYTDDKIEVFQNNKMIASKVVNTDASTGIAFHVKVKKSSKGLHFKLNGTKINIPEEPSYYVISIHQDNSNKIEIEYLKKIPPYM